MSAFCDDPGCYMMVEHSHGTATARSQPLPAEARELVEAMMERVVRCVCQWNAQSPTCPLHGPKPDPRDHALELAERRLEEMQQLYVPALQVDLWTMHPDVRGPLLDAIRKARGTP